ncbi:hypothetical protein Tco_0780202 [Tanacetum coccineum]
MTMLIPPQGEPSINQPVVSSVTKNAKESWALLEDLALYDNESWNEPRDFAKLVKVISLPQDVLSTSDRRLIELKNKVQRLMEAHLAPSSFVQVNKITSSCEICSGPHDTQYCLENPGQAFVDYASSHDNKVGGRGKKVIEDNLGDRACKNTKEVEKVREWMEYEEPIDLVDTRDESVYESLIEKMLSCSLNLDFRIKKGDLSNLKILCMIRHKFIANAYINLDSPMNLMSLACYNAIRNQGYEFRGKNFVRIGRCMHVFVGNMSYIMDFTILENLKANIDPSLSQVVCSRPFVEMTKLILDREQGLVTFKDGIKEVTIKTPHKDPEMDDLTSEGHDLLSSRVVLSEDDYRRGCERASDLESGFYMDVDKLDLSYKEETDRINLDGPLEVGEVK